MHSNPYAYYRNYSRALVKYVNNGFFSRDLDADDIAFIEQVRESGRLRSGSLASLTPTDCTYSDDVIARVALIEEMDFWHLPYRVDGSSVRRHGPVIQPKPRASGTTPHAISRKQRRAQLISVRAAIEAAAFAANVKRQTEQVRRDIEWELAAPKPKLKFGGVDGRYYVPQWKIDEAKRRLKISRARCRILQQTIQTDSAWIKRRMAEILREIFPQTITLEKLGALIGCEDKAMLIDCARQVVEWSQARFTDEERYESSL